MQHSEKSKPTISRILGLGVMLAVLLMVACGAAATPVVVEKEVVAEEEAVVEKEAVREGEKIVVATPVVQVPPAGAIKMRDKLIVLTESFGNEVFDPRYQEGDKNEWNFSLHSRLMAADKDKNFTKKGIATKWEITDGGLGWEWTIREGLMFHNGDPLTVEDVIFSLRNTFNELSESVITVRDWRLIDQHATATGPNSFKILFKQPHMSFPVRTSEIGMDSNGAIISKAYFESVGSDGFTADPNPGTSGPFELIEHRPAEEMLYQKFPDHLEDSYRTYAFDQLSFRLVPELSTRLAALKAGEAHIIPGDLTVLDQIEAAGARVIYGPESTVIWFLPWGCSKDMVQTRGLDKQGRPLMCSDKRVRYALDYALDKETIQELMGGPEVFQIKGSPLATPSGVGYLPTGELDPFPYDPERAQALFQEAGYKVPGVSTGADFNYGEDWIVWTWPGGATVPQMVEMTQLVCDMWKEVLGIKCKINVGEETTIKDRLYAGEIPGQYLIRSNEHDYDGGSKFRGRFADPEGSYISYDPTIKPMVDALLAATDPEEREKLYYKAHKAAVEAHWDFSPGYLNAPYGVTNDIVSWEPWPIEVSPSALWTVRWRN